MASQLPNATYRAYGMATSGDTLIYPDSDRQYGHYPRIRVPVPNPPVSGFQVVGLATPTPGNLPAGVYAAYSMSTSGDTVILGAAAGNAAHVYGLVVVTATNNLSLVCLGIADTSGSIRAVGLVTRSGGLARCSGAIAVHLLVAAAGLVVTSGAIVPSVRLIGATSVATTSGQISAVALSVVLLGIAKASGAIPTVTINAQATAAGIAKAIGSAYLVAIGATAVGQVKTLGSCTIPLPASQVGCVSGSGGPITPSPPNAVY